MSAKRLVVYVPGITMKVKQWEPLISRLNEEPAFGDTTFKGWNHGVGLLSTHSLMSRANELRAVIDAEWQLSGGYDEIVLIGHSMGGILVRQCYLLASGCYPDEPGSVWADRVKQFVLLAAVNRGLDQSQWRVRAYDLLTRFLGTLFFRRYIAQDFISGSEALTDLRLSWIRHMRSLDSGRRPGVVQILGTVDSIVTRQDSVDLEQFPNASHLSIPGINHRQVPLLDEGPNAEMRYVFIRKAILGEEFAEVEQPRESEKNDRIVFVLHGIRAANRGWVQSLEEKIDESMPGARVVTPGYGYLSALEFAVPFLHRRPIRTFQQAYSDYAVENPGAEFHFIGHSNGTYILGQSLKALKSMKFRNVVLAGSVLPRNFGWRKLMSGDDPQVGTLRNDCANTDWPVGFLCSGLRGLFRKDVGTGGYEGFLEDDEKVIQYWFHDGGHGAALDEQNLRSIAAFLAGDEEAGKPDGLSDEKPAFSLFSRMAPWLFRLLVAVLLGIVVYAIGTQSLSAAATFAGVLVIIAFILKIL